MKRVLILEPYYGGSHKLFLQGLQQTVDADYTLLTLPPRKWKMRMQLSALWFIEKIKDFPEQERFFDTVLCSTFVDVAVFRSLLISIKGWNPATRINTYFHENQFAYPGQIDDPAIRQFTAINFTTALASDHCAFNSKYNFETFMKGIELFLKKAADMKLQSSIDDIRRKSVIIYPGMDYSTIDQVKNKKNERKTTNHLSTLVWNHRWEHDKGPDDFFEALYTIQRKGVEFRLIVLGESFANRPDCFETAHTRLQKQIVHFGYAESRRQYAELLHQGDLIISTARHEFFGISVLEGIRAGCFPLLPDDLSYPELYDERYLYKPGKLVRRLEALLKISTRLDSATARALTGKFDWQQSRAFYKKFLFGNCSE